MRAIGTTDLRIYPLALGGNTFGWTADEATSQEILDAFVASGGNFVDTADSYSAWVPGNAGGESETILGTWMAARKNRGSMVIATKVSQHPQFKGLSPRNVAAAAEASLRRLQTDRIDLYFAHYDDTATPLEETVAAFDALVRAGKVRHVGLSNYSATRIEKWIRIATEHGFALPVALQPHYNLVARASFEQNLAPIAAQHRLGVFPYYSLASGFLTGKYRARSDAEGARRSVAVSRHLNDDGLRVITALDEIATARKVSIATTALAWLLHKPTITAPLASVSKAAQLPELMAARRLALTATEVARLDEASKPFA